MSLKSRDIWAATLKPISKAAMASSESQSELESTAVVEQVSSFSTTLDTTSSSRLNATRLELERRQLLHTIQLLKLELSQKQLLMDSLRTEHASQIEEFQDQLSDAECARKLVEHKLRAVTNAYKEELRHSQQQLTAVCDHKENHNESIRVVNYNEVSSALQLPLLSEEEFHELCCRESSTHTLQDHIKMKLYEIFSSYVKEINALRSDLQLLNAQLEENEQQQKNSVSVDESKMIQLQTQCAELRSEVERLSSLSHHSSFKLAHYSTLKSERDGLEKELEATRRSLVEKELRQCALVDERDRLKTEFTAAEQKVALLCKDKEHLKSQFLEQTQHLQTAKEKGNHFQQTLEEVRRSKEELYRQFVKTREELKTEYDHRLQHELDALRHRTNIELDQLKSQTRDMYERENRALKEDRDSAYAERDRVLLAQKNLEEKHDQLIHEFREFQLESRGTVADLQSTVKVKTLNSERSQLLHEEALKNLEHLQLEREKLTQKIELLSKELLSLTLDRDLKVKELEGKVKDLSSRVEGYDKLENELDSVVLQAAEMESGPEADRVLLSYGFGASMPTTSRRRMQQSVQLARRVLKMERVNSSLRQQLEVAEKHSTEQSGRLASLTEQLQLSKQPHKYLIECLQAKDEHLQTARSQVTALEDKISHLENEQRQLIVVKDEMASDLERLLSHREEISLMKQLVLGADSTRGEPCPRTNNNNSQKPLLDPKPTIFTKKPPHTRYPHQHNPTHR